MNDNQQFDEHIRSQFNDYAPDVHPRIWENIVARKDKKRPIGFWFILSGYKLIILLCILLGAGIGTGIYFKKSAGSGTEKKPVVKFSEKNTQSASLSLQKNTSPGETGNKSKEKLHDLPVTVSNNDVGQEILVNPVSPFSSRRVKITTHSPLATTNENLVTKEEEQTNSTSFTLPENTDEEKNIVPTGSGLSYRSFYWGEKIGSKQKEKSSSLSFNPSKLFPDCPSFEKNSAGNKKYFEAYIGPDYAFRSFKDTGNSGYMQRRKESTKFVYGFSAGIRYTKVFNNAMSIRAGINYSQLTEKFTYSQGNIIQIVYIINNNGDTIGSYNTTGKRYKTTFNQYRSLDIPIAIGYELGNSRWHANINAGVAVNIYSWQKGEVLDTAYQPVLITTGKNSSPYQFKTNAGIGFIGGVSVYYKLNDKLHFMAEPYFRYNLSPFTKHEITLKQKNHILGLRLGIRFDLR